MVLVKNLHGTHDNAPPHGCDSWRDFWEQSKRRHFGKCACIDCSRNAEVGGHVIKVYGSKDWYIVPLCAFHNNPYFTDSFCVFEQDLASVR